MGGKRFVDFLEQYARRNRLVLKHCSEHRPARVQHGLRHPGFRKTGCVHVANEDRTMLLNETGAEFVEEVFPAIGDLRMDRFHTLFMTRPLRDGQRLLRPTIDALRLHLFARGDRGKILQAEVDPDSGCTFRALLLDVDTEIGVPAASRILAEAARTQPILGKAVTVPQAEELSCVAKLTILVGDGADFEGNPAERLARTTRDAPAQLRLLELLASSDIFLSHALHGLAVNAQAFFTRAGSVLGDIEGAEEFAGALRMLVGQFVDKIPNHIALTGHRLQRPGMFVFDSDSQSSHAQIIVGLL